VRTVGRLLLTASLLLGAAAQAAEEPFAVQVLPSVGRTVTAELTDLDGDGRQDVLQAVVSDLPPNEHRTFRLRLQRPDGSIPASHDLEIDVPSPTAAYDIANVDGVAGDEVLLLQPRGLVILSFVRADDGTLAVRRRDARIPEDLTLGAAPDERGLDRISIASFAFGPEAWLIVPGIGETFFLAVDGTLRARIMGGARANYFIQPPGPMLTESDIQIFLDAPRISIGDIDGDGRVDILASSRHQLRVFLRREDGSYPRAADRTIALGRVSLEDHIRGSGSVRSIGRDIDGDGLLDLLLSLTIGGVMDASSNSYVHLNKGSGWNLDKPDATYESASSLSADQLVDLDGDGRLEIVRMGIPISVLELVEIFVQRALDAWLRAYAIGNDGDRDGRPEPLLEQKFALPLDFDTSRPAGFIPTIEFDLNGDGLRDYLSAHDGTRIEIYLGTRGSGFDKTATQEFSTEGQIRGGDLDGDGLPDFVLFNSRRLDEPVQVITNRGVLPGTPRRTSIRGRKD
jgi:hypothetical protein